MHLTEPLRQETDAAWRAGYAAGYRAGREDRHLTSLRGGWRRLIESIFRSRTKRDPKFF